MRGAAVARVGFHQNHLVAVGGAEDLGSRVAGRPRGHPLGVTGMVHVPSVGRWLALGGCHFTSLSRTVAVRTPGRPAQGGGAERARSGDVSNTDAAPSAKSSVVSRIPRVAGPVVADAVVAGAVEGPGDDPGPSSEA